MHRFRFVLYRPLQLLPVLLGISIVSFVLVHAIPGDPVRAIIGPKATPEVVERVRAQYGLDQPVVVQYLKFLQNLAHGEMGRSIVYKTGVVDIVTERIAASAFLLAYAVVPALCLTVPLAITAALWRGSPPDHLIRMLSTAGRCCKASHHGADLRQPTQRCAGIRVGFVRPGMQPIFGGFLRVLGSFGFSRIWL